jgi:hypothetical protein
MDKATELTEDLRQDVTDLNSLTAADINNLTTAEAIQLGHALWDLINAANQAMDLVKQRMRSMSNGSDRTFLGGDSVCHVNLTADYVNLNKDVDVAALRETLGAGFASLFREQVEPVAEFMERLDDLPEDQARVALAAVGFRSRASRVTFTEDRKARG